MHNDKLYRGSYNNDGEWLGHHELTGEALDRFCAGHTSAMCKKLHSSSECNKCSIINCRSGIDNWRFEQPQVELTELGELRAKLAEANETIEKYNKRAEEDEATKKARANISDLEFAKVSLKTEIDLLDERIVNIKKKCPEAIK